MFDQQSTRMPDINDLRERLIKVLENSPEPLYKRCKTMGMTHKTVLDFLHQRRKVYWKTVFKIKDFVEREEKRI